MRINRKFKGSKAKDDKGYLKSNEANFTPYKDIGGGDITMKGVDLPLLAIPMDKDGKPLGMKFMKPGSDYEFGGAHNTIEIPVYKKGGKSEWMSDKIAKLIGEGYPQKQAVAIAYSMYERRMDGGIMDYMQSGGPTPEDLKYSRDQWLKDNKYYDTIDGAIKSVEGTYGGMQSSTAVASDPSVNIDPAQQKVDEIIKAKGIADNSTGPEMAGKQAVITPEQEAEAKRKIAEQNGQGDPYQFFNPYAGVDIPTAANLFGQGIGKGGDPKMAVAAGAKLALGLGRNIVSGMGRANSNDFAIKDYEERQRQALLNREAPTEYIGQEGGQLSSQDMNNIRKDTGIAFDDSYINEVFSKVQPKKAGVKPTMYEPNLGQYKGLDYFKNPMVRDNNISLETSKGFPGNTEMMDQYVSNLKKENPGYNVDIKYTPRSEFFPNPLEQKFNDINAEQKTSGVVKNQYQDGGITTEELKKRRSAAVIANRMHTVEDRDKFLSNFEDKDLVKYIQQYAELEPKDRESQANDLFKKVMGREGKWSAEPIKYAGDQIGSTIKEITNNIFHTSYEKGGLIDEEAMMTGNYSTEIEPEGANVEVEENEYIKTPSGSLTKVLGDKHEDGGEKMKLEEGTKIISDHLKIKADQAKMLRDKFDMDVKTKDTYAKVMDKFYKKSGLQSLIDEEAEVIKTIKDQKEKLGEDKGKDEATRNINLEFLSSKLNDIDKAKKPLMEAANMFFDKTYELQEKSKPKSEADMEEYQIGGQVYNSDQIVELGKKYNITPDEARAIAKKMQAGGQADGNDYQNPTRMLDFSNAMKVRGYTGPLYDPNKKYTKDELDVLAGKLQDFAAENATDDIVKYFSNPDSKVTITAKGVGKLLLKDPSIAKEAGVSVKSNPADYSEEERMAIKKVAESKNLIDKEFIIDQFKDQKWAYRAPIFKADNVLDPKGAASVVPDVNMIQGDNTNDNKNIPDPNNTQPAKDSNGNTLPGRGVYLTPDQSLLPPTGMIPSTKIERRYGRMDAERFTPDQQLSELNRSVDAAMSQLETLPSGQREAATVQLQANKQQQTDKIVGDVERANKQIAQQEQAFNIRQSDREVDASALDTLSFEQRSLGALANTEDDFRRYFNEGQRRNVEKFKEIENLNLVNSLYENFDITPEGIKNTVGSGLSNEDLLNAIRMQQALPKDTTDNKKAKGQSGGRIATARRRRNSRVKSALKFDTPNNTGWA